MPASTGLACVVTKGLTVMAGEPAPTHIVSSSISRRRIREMMADGFDTLWIAKHYGLKEADVWNMLGESDER